MASEEDFDDLVENPAGGSGYALMGGATPAWPRVARILKSMKGLWKARYGTDARLDGFILGDAKVRIFADANGDWKIQVNTGTAETPVWTENIRYRKDIEQFIFNADSIASVILVQQTLVAERLWLIGPGGIGIDCSNLPIQNVSQLQAQIVSVLDELDMNGRPIVDAGAVNAASYNGFTLGGSVAPEPVGIANIAGGSAFFARANHEHQGIHEIDVDGAGNLHGDVNFISGDRVAVLRSAQDITVQWNPRRQTTSNASGADQTGIGSGVETNVAGLSAIPIVEANGVRSFRLSLHMNVTATGAGWIRATVYAGTNGQLSDGASARVCEVYAPLVLDRTQSIQIPEFSFVPAAGQNIGVSVYFDVGGVGTVHREEPKHGQLSLHHV